jgi:hypothetical protein
VDAAKVLEAAVISDAMGAGTAEAAINRAVKKEAAEEFRIQ